MPEPTTEERIAQLEQIVATQSDMILKLVEMMNYLGQELATTNEKLTVVQATAARQFDELGTMLKQLVAGLNHFPPPSPN